MKHVKLSLFDTPEARVLGLLHSIKAAMQQAAAAAGDGRLSREQIADRMQEVAKRAGVRLTARGDGNFLTTLEKWLNPKDSEHVPTLVGFSIFCLVTGSTEPLAALAQVAGVGLMGEQDRRLRDYGLACYEERELRRRKRKLEEKL